MRMSDWSSEVCSSDLPRQHHRPVYSFFRAPEGADLQKLRPAHSYRASQKEPDLGKHHKTYRCVRTSSQGPRPGAPGLPRSRGMHLLDFGSRLEHIQQKSEKLPGHSNLDFSPNNRKLLRDRKSTRLNSSH